MNNIYTLTASFCEDSVDIFVATSKEEATRLLRLFIPMLIAECERVLPEKDKYYGRAFWATHLESYCYNYHFEKVKVMRTHNNWSTGYKDVVAEEEEDKYVGMTLKPIEEIFNNLYERICERTVDVLYVPHKD